MLRHKLFELYLGNIKHNKRELKYNYIVRNKDRHYRAGNRYRFCINDRYLGFHNAYNYLGVFQKPFDLTLLRKSFLTDIRYTRNHFNSARYFCTDFCVVIEAAHRHVDGISEIMTEYEKLKFL